MNGGALFLDSDQHRAVGGIGSNLATSLDSIGAMDLVPDGGAELVLVPG